MSHDLEPHDVVAAVRDLATLVVTPATTEAEAIRAMVPLAPFNGCLLGVTRFAGQTPWERHPDGDELLHVLDGTIRVTVLTRDGPVERTLHAGQVLVVPRDLWHRQDSGPGAALLFVTAAPSTAHSWDDDPR